MGIGESDDFLKKTGDCINSRKLNIIGGKNGN